jgi:tRNA U34 5-carboxymethylaminomethyl modifying GTPase MnmE/TrmE
MSRNLNHSKYWVDFAMKLTSKDVRPPKCVRDGIVKPIEEENMKDEYIIINKTDIQQRIEELENLIEKHKSNRISIEYRAELKGLTQVLSQSTPLIPEIEKAFYGGQRSLKEKVLPKKTSQDYISNLKLNI